MAISVSILDWRVSHPEEAFAGHVKRTARVTEEATEKERALRRLTDDVAMWAALGRHELAHKGRMAIERLRNARSDANGKGAYDSYDLAMKRADRARRRADVR
jgi:hypothetical protein